MQERIIVAAILTLPFVLYFRYVFGGEMLYGSDWLLSGYAAREFIAEYIASHGRLPLWNPFLFGGVPTVAAFYGDIFYPTTLFRVFLPVHLVWSYTFAAHIALSGVATYYFSRDLGLNRYASAVGALAYMFCGSLVSMTNPGHDGKLICSSFLPVAFLFFNKALNSGKLYYFVFAGAAIGFPFMVGHVQMAYYMVLSLFLFLVFRLVGMWRDTQERPRMGRAAIYSILAVLFMLCLISVQFLPVYEYMPSAARGSERGYRWATSWSLPTSELVDLITPHFSGLEGRYWGTNYFKLDSQYLGVLPLLLAPLALLGKRPRNVKFFTGLLLLGVIMALGGHTPLYRLAYYVIPGVKKFRGPSMIFFIASFSAAMLSGFGAARLMQDLREEQKKRVFAYLLFVLGAVFLFLIISAASRQSIIDFISSRVRPYIASNYSPSLASQKIANLRSNYRYFLGGLSWALFLFAANAGLIYLIVAKKVRRESWAVLACLLLVVDLWIADHYFIRSAPRPKEYFAADEVVRFLKTRDGIFRVFPFRYEHTNDNLLMHHRIQSVGGYHGNQLQSYQDFIGAGRSVMFSPKNLNNQNFLDILNVRYIVSVVLPEDVSRFDARTREAIRSIREFFDRENFREVFVGRTYTVYENVSALERAVLVPGCEIMPKGEILSRMKDDSFDPKDLVILEEDPGLPLPGGKGPVGNVEIVEYGENRIVMKTDSPENCILFVSENFYNQWRARVDGKEAKIYTADYTMRGIPVPAGSHTVQMEYDSSAMKMGVLLSILSFLLLVTCAFAWYRDQKRLMVRGGAREE